MFFLLFEQRLIQPSFVKQDVYHALLLLEIHIQSHFQKLQILYQRHF